MRKKRSVLSIVVAVVMTIAMMPASAFASTNLDGMTEMQKEAVKDNYWAELNAYKDPSLSEEDEKMVIPTYLNSFFDTSAVKWAETWIGDFQEHTLLFPHAGIRSESDNDTVKNLIENEDVALMYMSLYALDKHKETPAYDYWKGGKIWNPYNFDLKNDIIYEQVDFESEDGPKVTDEKVDYNIYGDLIERGGSSTEVATHEIGDRINLDFSVDLELCRKMLNTMLLSSINSEFPAQELMKRNMPETGLMATDAELVYVLDLPKGLENDGTTTFTIDGLEGFSVTTAEENDGSRLVLRVRKDQNDKGYDTLKETYAKIQNVHAATMKIDGLRVTNKAPIDTNLTATGYAYGAYDQVWCSDNDTIINKDCSAVRDNNAHQFARTPSVFAAKQSASGRDVTADAEKPNLITYIFKVKKSVAPPVAKKYKLTFVANGGKKIATKSFKAGTKVDLNKYSTRKGGNVFGGWYTDKQLKKKAASVKMTKNQKVYAKWHVFLAKAVPKAKKSMTISWKKVPGAAKYVVYGNRCNYGKHKFDIRGKRFKTVKGKTSAVTVKGLRPHCCYKFMVQAVDKKGKVIASSLSSIHNITSGGLSGYSMDAIKSINAKKSITVKKGKTVKMTEKVISFHGRSPIQKGHAPKLRFVTENEAIAKFTVKSSNKAGVLKGIDKGTCYVYTCGVNGSWVKTKVTVK